LHYYYRIKYSETSEFKACILFSKSKIIELNKFIQKNNQFLEDLTLKKSNNEKYILDLIYERDQRENQMIVLNVDKETKLKVLWERITDTNLQIENQEKRI